MLTTGAILSGLTTSSCMAYLCRAPSIIGTKGQIMEIFSDLFTFDHGELACQRFLDLQSLLVFNRKSKSRPKVVRRSLLRQI